MSYYSNINRNMIKLSLHASNQTYFTNPDLSSYFPNCQFKQINNVVTGQVVTIFSGNVFENEISKKLYIISFRGTDDYSKDWIKNFGIFKTEVNMPVDFDCSTIRRGWFGYGPRIHSGFWDGYTSLKDDIYQFFDNEAKENNLNGSNILITGHSLGQALSMCCAYDVYHWKSKYNVSISVIGIGGPRCFNWYATQLMNAMYPDGLRIVNPNDIVTNLVAINAYHCFKPIKLWSKTYWECFVNCEWIPRISPHLMKNYMKHFDN